MLTRKGVVSPRPDSFGGDETRTPDGCERETRTKREAERERWDWNGWISYQRAGGASTEAERVGYSLLRGWRFGSTAGKRHPAAQPAAWRMAPGCIFFPFRLPFPAVPVRPPFRCPGGFPMPSFFFLKKSKKKPSTISSRLTRALTFETV